MITGRQIALLTATAFAVGSPIVQAVGNIGLSPSEFSRSGDRTLRVAGYAFSIWSLIYAALLVFAVHQALPRQRDDPGLRAIFRPTLVAIAGTGLWIWAAALDARWASVAIIMVSAGYLTLGLVRVTEGGGRRPSLPAAAFVWWPLSLLAGWLTVASPVNVLTVLTAEGLLLGAAPAAALIGIGLTLVVALLVIRIGRLPIFGAPVAWGLVAIGVAERGSNSALAAIAAASGALVAGYSIWQSRRSSRRAWARNRLQVLAPRLPK